MLMAHLAGQPAALDEMGRGVIQSSPSSFIEIADGSGNGNGNGSFNGNGSLGALIGSLASGKGFPGAGTNPGSGDVGVPNVGSFNGGSNNLDWLKATLGSVIRSGNFGNRAVTASAPAPATVNFNNRTVTVSAPASSAANFNNGAATLSAPARSIVVADGRGNGNGNGNTGSGNGNGNSGNGNGNNNSGNK